MISFSFILINFLFGFRPEHPPLMHQQTSIDSNNTRTRSQSEPPPSPPTNRNIVRSESEEKLQAKRREWEESTAKRNVKTYFFKISY